MQKQGSIKLGGTQNGLPIEFMEFVVTKAHKGNEDNFVSYPGIEPSSSIKVQLGSTLEDCFETGRLAFVKIEGLSYYVKGLNGSALAYPLEPNWEDPTEDLPVIDLGDIIKFGTEFEMIEQAILKVKVVGIDSSNLFYWKTKSAYSISDTLHTLNVLKGMNLEEELLLSIPMNLSVFTRYRKDKEVTYGRLELPSEKDLLIGFEKQTNGISLFNKKMIESVNAIKNLRVEEALSLKEACQYFDVDNLNIEVDADEEDNEIINIPEKKVTNEIEDNQLKELFGKLEGKVPEMILKSAMVTFGEKTEEIVIEEKYNIESIIKRISKGE
jgi:hypothetical protein